MRLRMKRVWRLRFTASSPVLVPLRSCGRGDPEEGPIIDVGRSAGVGTSGGTGAGRDRGGGTGERKMRGWPSDEIGAHTCFSQESAATLSTECSLLVTRGVPMPQTGAEWARRGRIGGFRVGPGAAPPMRVFCQAADHRSKSLALASAEGGRGPRRVPIGPQPPRVFFRSGPIGGSTAPEPSCDGRLRLCHREAFFASMTDFPGAEDGLLTGRQPWEHGAIEPVLCPHHG